MNQCARLVLSPGVVCVCFLGLMECAAARMEEGSAGLAGGLARPFGFLFSAGSSVHLLDAAAVGASQLQLGSRAGRVIQTMLSK